MFGDSGMTMPRGLPTGFQYQEAMQHPERCFSDPDLRSASFERMTMGLPKMISGNFASVFPVTSASGHKYAMKCFTRKAPNQLQRYSIIGAHLNKLHPKWATDFRFVPEGIQVDGSRYPILLMNWINGVTLTRWISDNVNGGMAIASIARRFDDMVHDLATYGMAHGDLQSGNLLIGDNDALFLVDYDGMYVPGLDALPAGEIGHPDYQPPSRSQADYGPAMDRFSAWLISLSLKILAADPSLWDQLNPAHDEYLLLDRTDLLDVGSSSRFSVLSSHRDSEVRRLAQIMRGILTLPLAAIPSPASLSSGDTQTPDSVSEAPASRIPDWMRSYVSEPENSQRQSNSISFSAQEDRHGAIRSRQHTWLVRSLVVLPLVTIVGVVWDWRISLAMCVTASYLVTLSLWHLYRRYAPTLIYTELRRARRKADSAVSRAAGKISDAQQEKVRAERSLQRLVNQHAKKRTSIQADFSGRQRKVSRETESMDRGIADQVAAIQRDLDSRLADMDKRHQAELIPVNQRIAELAAQLGQAYSDHLAAQRQLSDWDSRLAAAVRPKFSRFVIGAIRGVDL
jgi:hypothetical protein